MASIARNLPSVCMEFAANDTQSRLIRGLRALWVQYSQAEISVRMVAREADASVSAIDYHFGNLEQLFVHAQSAALQEAEAWLEELLVEIRGLAPASLPVPARAALLASVIERWTGDQRPLALAWREANAAAANPELSDPHRRWTALWRGVWARLCEEGVFSGNPDLLALFFDGEASQHLIRWHHLLDRALLDETTFALFQFMECHSSPSSAVRIRYQDLAEREYRLDFGEREDFTAIDDAAAAILGESGLASLTFRSVAKRANSTLGAVSYHFGSKSKMLRLALQRIYEGSAGESRLNRVDALPADREAVVNHLLSVLADQRLPLMRALDEIILNLSRGEDDRALGGVIRGFRDPLGRALLGKVLGDSEYSSPALAAVFSSVVRGLFHWSVAVNADILREIGRPALDHFQIPTNSNA